MKDGDARGPSAPAPTFFMRRRGQALDHLPHALAIGLAVLAIAALKRVGFFHDLMPDLQLALLAALLLALAPVRARDVSRPLLILSRTIALLFAVYAVAAYPALSEHYVNRSLHSELLLRWTGPAAVAGAILAWFRPGFGLVPVMLVTWKKIYMAGVLGFPLNSTDYYPVAELGVFVCLAAGVAVGMERLLDRRGLPVPGRDDSRWSLGEAAFLGAFSIHMANYFWSAIAKSTLPGAGPLTWVLENETHDIMLATAASGLGPLLSIDAVAWASHEFMNRFQVVTNFATWAIQLAALFALVRLRWAAALTVIYDLMHLMIFLTTSILFWKWMTVNLGLVLALRGLRGREAPPWPLTAMGMAITLLAPLVFWVAWLGWFDSKALNRPSVEAVTEDGRRVPVPNTYFLEVSAQMSKASVGDPFVGHFQDIGVFGKAELGYEQMVAARDCALPVAEESGLSQSFERNPRMARWFVEHHRYMLANAGEDGRHPYVWFPHHNWANPALYGEFAALDLRDIVAYRYIIDSICLSYDGEGGVAETLKLRGVHEIPVR